LPNAASVNSQSICSTITPSPSTNHSSHASKSSPKRSSPNQTPPAQLRMVTEEHVIVDLSSPPSLLIDHAKNPMDTKTYASCSKESPVVLPSFNTQPAKVLSATPLQSHTDSGNMHSQMSPSEFPCNPSHSVSPTAQLNAYSVSYSGMPDSLTTVSEAVPVPNQSKVQTASVNGPHEKSTQSGYSRGSPRALQPLSPEMGMISGSKSLPKSVSSASQSARFGDHAHEARDIAASPAPILPLKAEHLFFDSSAQHPPSHLSGSRPQPPGPLAPLNTLPSDTLSHRGDPTTHHLPTSHQPSSRLPLPAKAAPPPPSPLHRFGASISHSAFSHQPPARTHQHSVSLPTNYSSATTPTSQSTLSRPPGYVPATVSVSTEADASSAPTATSTRVPISGHMQTSTTPPRAQQPPRSPSKESVLCTPSSLAQSIALQQPMQSRSGSRASAQSEESTKRKGFFGGFFKTITPAHKDHDVWHPSAEKNPATRPESRSAMGSSRKNGADSAYANVSESKLRPTRGKAPPPKKATATLDTPAAARRPSSPRAPTTSGSKILSPFRFLTSHRRHRTVSTASIEALDGTTAVSRHFISDACM
jgi:hypothetical protein